jgi:hypothetical protein
MRYGLGLLALLVVVAIILVLQAYVTVPTVHKGMEAREQAQQIAGVDESGGRVSDSYDLKTEMDNGKIRGLRVTRLSSTSPMKTYYDLRVGDVIVEYGAAGNMMKVREESDADLAKSMVAEAYQRHQPLLVMRNGQPVKLDGEEKKLPGQSSSPNPADNSLEGQLDKIKTPR